MEKIPEIHDLQNDKQPGSANSRHTSRGISSLPYMHHVFRNAMAKARLDCMKIAEIQTLDLRKKYRVGINSFSLFDVMNEQEVDQFCLGITELRDEQGKLQMRQYWRIFAWTSDGKAMKVLIG